VSIGQTLAAARREAGLSIDDVSAKTRLRATVVRAIENDDFSLCGGDFYARAHIRTIAGLVGADSAALIEEFDAHAARSDDDVPASQVFEAEMTGRAISRRVERHAPNWGVAAAVMVLVAVIVVAAVQLVNNGGSKNQAAVGPISGSTTPTASPSPTHTTSPSPTPSSSPPPTSAPGSAVAQAGVTVVLDVTTDKCWVLAKGSDGSQLFEGTMNPGDTKTFEDAQRISLKLGNAPATDLTVNGVHVGAPPSQSSVAAVSFGPGDPTVAKG
jgi:cytoskeletal protein RodZ